MEPYLLATAAIIWAVFVTVLAYIDHQKAEFERARRKRFRELFLEATSKWITALRNTGEHMAADITIQCQYLYAMQAPVNGLYVMPDNDVN